MAKKNTLKDAGMAIGIGLIAGAIFKGLELGTGYAMKKYDEYKESKNIETEEDKEEITVEEEVDVKIEEEKKVEVKEEKKAADEIAADKENEGIATIKELVEEKKNKKKV